MIKNLFEICRVSLLNAISGLPDSPHKSMKFAHYQNLVYSIVLGKTAKELRKDFKIRKRSSVVDHLSSDQLSSCCNVMADVIVKINEGKEYKQIKKEITNVGFIDL